MIMKKRKTEISLFNALLAMIVVLIHLMSAPMAELPPEVPLYKAFLAVWRLCSFVVQAFIFLSAVKTFLGGKSENYGKFLLKRLRTVILPYIAAVFIYYLYFVYIEEYFPFKWSDYLGYLVRGDMAAQFYFVIVIAEFYLLYPLWKHTAAKWRPAAVIIASAAVNIVLGAYSYYWLDKFFNGYVFTFGDRLFTTYIMYWTGGMYAGIYYDKFTKFITKYRPALCAAFVLTAIVDVVTLYMQKYGRIPPLHLDMIHSLYCVSAILFGMSLMYAAREKKIPGAAAADRASYYVYLFHVLFIFWLDKVIMPIVISETGLSSTTLTFAVRAVMTYILCIALIAVNQIIYLIRSKLKNARSRKTAG